MPSGEQMWNIPMLACKRCGASWSMPKDEPHACPVQEAQESERRIVGLGENLRDALEPFAAIEAVEEGDIFNMEQVEAAKRLVKAWDDMMDDRFIAAVEEMS